MTAEETYVRRLEDLSSGDVPIVGGKNASLGEMIRSLQDKGIRVPGGFATTAVGYLGFLEANDLRPAIEAELATLDGRPESLERVGARIRKLFLGSDLPAPLAEAIRQGYREFSRECGVDQADVAVRSSATAEDLPQASFAGQQVTVSCAEGDEGHVYGGRLHFTETELDLTQVPETRTRIMMNIASPPAAFRWWRLPCHGIGLARMEFIINNVIKVHPMALVRFDQVLDGKDRLVIARLTRGDDDKTEYFVDRLAQGIAKIAASQYPEPVIVRTSDFKTNEYAALIGGSYFEPREDNPMIGFRGASRYYSDRYREAFALECKAIRRVRDEMGLRNVIVMIPFCRTVQEADRVLEVMAANGLRRGGRRPATSPTPTFAAPARRRATGSRPPTVGKGRCVAPRSGVPPRWTVAPAP